MPVRLLIADDHHVVRHALTALLGMDPDIEVVGEAANGVEALQRARDLLPDVVLMDLQMPGMDGIAATSAIRTELPSVQVLALTSVPEEQGVARAVRAGAIGYVMKTSDPDTVAGAVKGAAAGQTQLSAAAMTWLLREPAPASARGPQLTGREHDVLGLMSQGLSNRAIAASLHVGEKTVKTHVSNILAKLDVDSRTQAVLQAQKLGLTSEE